jgi:SAM-dependent methyltransferase
MAMSVSADLTYIEWKDWGAELFGRFSALEALYFQAELGAGMPAGARVLEIGFGNGAVLGWLKSIGAEPYGVEANPVLVERAQRMLGAQRAFRDLGDLPDAALACTFTHVVAFDVVEHIPLQNLAPLFSRIRELLAPGGRFLFRCPNGDSPFGRIHQHGDPTHVTTLGRARIAYLAGRAGLDVEAIRSPALPLAHVGIRRSLKRLGILFGRACVERVVSLLYFGGQRIPLDPNYVAVLRR